MAVIGATLYTNNLYLYLLMNTMKNFILIVKHTLNKKIERFYTSNLPKPHAFVSLLIQSSLNPHYVTGFCDAESSFSVVLVKTLTTRVVSHYPRLVFKIGLSIRDKYLLEQISAFFNVGKVFLDGSDNCQYLV